MEVFLGCNELVGEGGYTKGWARMGITMEKDSDVVGWVIHYIEKLEGHCGRFGHSEV